MNLIRLARGPGPPSRRVLDRLAAVDRFAGPRLRRLRKALSSWEVVYRKTVPDGPAPGRTEAPGPGLRPGHADRQRGPRRRGEDRVAGGAAGHRQGAMPGLPQVRRQGGRAGPRPDDRQQPVPAGRDPGIHGPAVEGRLRPVSLGLGGDPGRQGLQRHADRHRRPNLVLLLSDGTKVTIPKAEIEEQKASTTSVMPEGLLNPLSYQEIADLLALFNSMPGSLHPRTPPRRGTD